MIETTRRQLVKAVSWQMMGLVTMSLLGWAITGSWSVGGVFALASAAVGLVMFLLHEKLWARIAWGRVARS